MNDKLSYTVSEIYRLASAYASDVDSLGLRDVHDIFNATRSIPYVKDSDRGFDELLQRPKYTLVNGGDCDDKTIFEGAALNRLSIPWRIVTSAYDSDQTISHVYPEAKIGGTWKPLDATYPNSTIFSERRPTNRIVWSNPMINEGRYRVSTLEGVGLLPGTEVIASASLNLAGNLIKGLISGLKDLPLIGSLFRGATQHMTYDDARAKANEIGAKVQDVWNQLDAQGQDYFYQLASNYFNNGWLSRFGTWWEGFAQQEYAGWNKGTVSKYQYTNFYLSNPLFVICFKHDVEKLSEDLGPWYVEPTTRMVWEPLAQYVQQKTTGTTAGTPGNPIPQLPVLKAGGNFGLIAILGLAGALLLMPKKRRR